MEEPTDMPALVRDSISDIAVASKAKLSGLEAGLRTVAAAGIGGLTARTPAQLDDESTRAHTGAAVLVGLGGLLLGLAAIVTWAVRKRRRHARYNQAVAGVQLSIKSAKKHHGGAGESSGRPSDGGGKMHVFLCAPD